MKKQMFEIKCMICKTWVDVTGCHGEGGWFAKCLECEKQFAYIDNRGPGLPVKYPRVGNAMGFSRNFGHLAPDERRITEDEQGRK